MKLSSLDNTVRIKMRPKSSTQSGLHKSKSWEIIFPGEKNTLKYGLMGWNGGFDINSSFVMYFSSLEEAKQYAQTRRLNYIIES